jgi:aminoglycoside phosphotransferase (APT) family kinase protein
MEIPAELRRIPPKATLDWVAQQFGAGATVTGVRRLRNAWAAAMHAVDVDDARGEGHEVVLRRWARIDLPPDPGVVDNEAATLTLLGEVSNLPAPRLVAADPAGEVADVPALVMTRLRGRDDLAPLDLDRYLDALVAALHVIHSVPVGRDTLCAYRPWGLDRELAPPRWSTRPDVWTRAIAISRTPVPAYEPALCHRDFHPGNVLWHHGELSGIVDWTHACTGPVTADVAHCRANLSLLFGAEVADEFAHRYGPVADLAWFDVVDVVGFEPIDAWRWHDAGRPDITFESITAALDDFLAAAVVQLS